MDVNGKRRALHLARLRRARRWLCGALAGLALAGSARAEADVPPLGSFERVRWLVGLAGPMPRLLWGSLLLIGALLLICAIYCVKAGGKHGR